MVRSFDFRSKSQWPQNSRFPCLVHVIRWMTLQLQAYAPKFIFFISPERRIRNCFAGQKKSINVQYSEKPHTSFFCALLTTFEHLSWKLNDLPSASSYGSTTYTHFTFPLLSLSRSFIVQNSVGLIRFSSHRYCNFPLKYIQIERWNRKYPRAIFGAGRDLTPRRREIHLTGFLKSQNKHVFILSLFSFS